MHRYHCMTGEERNMTEELEYVRATLARQNIDIETVIAQVQAFPIETPSWGYGNSGTRFKVFPWPGAARNLREKLEDAAMVQRVTGSCPKVALHIPWDQVDDWRETSVYATHQ